MNFPGKNGVEKTLVQVETRSNLWFGLKNQMEAVLPWPWTGRFINVLPAHGCANQESIISIEDCFRISKISKPFKMLT